MIPNALASTGAYADFWSHLKSMDYALERCMDPELSPIGELDKDRLEALVIFLRDNFIPIPINDSIALDPDYYFQEPNSKFKFIPDFDLRQRLQEVPDFKSFRRESKMGMENKIKRLIIAIEDFITKNTKEIFKKEHDIPIDEFNILREILSALLSETQPALYL
jgi:hypothetical protein